MKRYCMNIEVDALRWDGNNTDEVIAFGEGRISHQLDAPQLLRINPADFVFHDVNVGDFIVRSKNTVSAMPPHIFHAMYTEVK